MLHVYSASWCPHCQQAIQWLEAHAIAFTVINIETADPALVAQVVAVNGGEDWVVPTLEYQGQWREGKIFDPESFKQDLVRLGVIPPAP